MIHFIVNNGFRLLTYSPNCKVEWFKTSECRPAVTIEVIFYIQRKTAKDYLSSDKVHLELALRGYKVDEIPLILNPAQAKSGSKK